MIKILPLIFLSTLYAREFTLSVGVTQVKQEIILPKSNNNNNYIDFEYKPLSFIAPSISIETKVWYLSTSLGYFKNGYDYEWEVDGAAFTQKERVDNIHINAYVPFNLNNFSFSIGGIFSFPFNIKNEFVQLDTQIYTTNFTGDLDDYFFLGPSFKIIYNIKELNNIKVCINSTFDYTLRDYYGEKPEWNPMKLSAGLGFIFIKPN